MDEALRRQGRGLEIEEVFAHQFNQQAQPSAGRAISSKPASGLGEESLSKLCLEVPAMTDRRSLSAVRFGSEAPYESGQKQSFSGVYSTCPLRCDCCGL